MFISFYCTSTEAQAGKVLVLAGGSRNSAGSEALALFVVSLACVCVSVCENLEMKEENKHLIPFISSPAAPWVLFI